MVRLAKKGAEAYRTFQLMLKVPANVKVGHAFRGDGCLQIDKSLCVFVQPYPFVSIFSQLPKWFGYRANVLDETAIP